MIMELPKNLRLPFAEVKEKTLVIYKQVRYEDLMYGLTYALKKRRCIYCGKKLNKKNSTLDHRYPRSTGGISITDNLFPCCQKCNSAKSGYTHEEFQELKRLSKEEQENYRQTLQWYKEKTLREKGFKLPRKWVIYENTERIKYESSPKECRGKKYKKIVKFYQCYGKLPRPIIVDKENHLLDGYNLILFAKDFQIPKVPVIKLENVILMVRS